jgi:PPM family protein phosphatase
MMTDETETDAEPFPDPGERAFEVKMAVRSDVGRVRSENQDFAITTTSEDVPLEHGYLMVVADGMGGHKGGATASRLAANGIKNSYLASTGEDVAASLREAIERANAEIHAEAESNPELEGMGTTASALVVLDSRAWIGHVGDSRIYRVRAGAIEQLTDDHSLVATMVKEGLLTAEEAEVHPRRNVLQRSMGVASEVEVDVVGPLELEPGDRFVLCSDGLHGLVRNDEILDLTERLDVETAADELIRMALDRGAHDNVTVIVARAEEKVTGTAAGPEDAVAAGHEDRKKGAASLGKSGCFLRWALILLVLATLAGSAFLLLSGDVFVGWFMGGR